MQALKNAKVGFKFLRPVFEPKIKEESIYYEHKKHDSSLPLIGVNTFLPKDHGGEIATEIELIRSTEEEKGRRLPM